MSVECTISNPCGNCNYCDEASSLVVWPPHGEMQPIVDAIEYNPYAAYEFEIGMDYDD